MGSRFAVRARLRVLAQPIAGYQGKPNSYRVPGQQLAHRGAEWLVVLGCAETDSELDGLVSRLIVRQRGILQ